MKIKWFWHWGRRLAELEHQLIELKEKFRFYRTTIKLACPYCHVVNVAEVDEKTKDIYIKCANCERKTIMFQRKRNG